MVMLPLSSTAPKLLGGSGEQSVGARPAGNASKASGWPMLGTASPT